MDQEEQSSSQLQRSSQVQAADRRDFRKSLSLSVSIDVPISRSSEDDVDRSDAQSAHAVELPNPPFFDHLPWRVVLAYGVGHFFNDLCASMWFTYLLLFLTKVLLFSNPSAGAIMLVGQVADALATPSVGYESDRTNWIRCCLLYGKRKSWHLLGTVFCALSFPFIFMRCIGCDTELTSELAQLIYYVPFVVIFQAAWASVQISHLALIPELTECAHERTTLNSVRYAFTVIANIVVFGSLSLLFQFDTVPDAQGHTHTKKIVPEDSSKFMILALGVTGVGCFFSFLFHVGTAEPKVRRSLSRMQSSVSRASLNRASDNMPVLRQMHWYDWFKEHQFYQVAVMYTCTRMFINLTQVFLPLYITETQLLSKEYTATVPLVFFLSSFLISTIFSIQRISRLLSRQAWYLLATIVGGGACVWMWFPNLQWQIYLVAVLLGSCSAILLVTSLGMTSDLICQNTESGAFVFGAMSFLDKLTCGIGIFIIQELKPFACDGSDNLDSSAMLASILHPAGMWTLFASNFVSAAVPHCTPAGPHSVPCTPICPATASFYRDIITVVPGGALALAMLCLLTLWPQEIGRRRGIPCPDEEKRRRPIISGPYHGTAAIANGTTANGAINNSDDVDDIEEDNRNMDDNSDRQKIL